GGRAPGVAADARARHGEAPLRPPGRELYGSRDGRARERRRRPQRRAAAVVRRLLEGVPRGRALRRAGRDARALVGADPRLPARALRRRPALGQRPGRAVRPHRADRGPVTGRHEEQARALVLAYGWNATAYQILNPGIVHWL